MRDIWYFKVIASESQLLVVEDYAIPVYNEAIMESLPDDPLLLQERVAGLSLENADLHQQVHALTQTVTGLNREKAGFQATLTVWRRAAEGQLDNTEAVSQLAEANSTIVEAEIDVLTARGARRHIAILEKSLLENRVTSARQQAAFVQAKMAEIKAIESAEREHKRAEQIRRDSEQGMAQLQAEVAEAVEKARQTETLRTFFHNDREQVLLEAEQAREREREAVARATKLEGADVRNTALEEENNTLRKSETAATARAATLEEEVTRLKEELGQRPQDLTQHPDFLEMQGSVEDLTAQVLQLTQENQKLRESGEISAADMKREAAQVAYLRRELGLARRGRSPILLALARIPGVGGLFLSLPDDGNKKRPKKR